MKVIAFNYPGHHRELFLGECINCGKRDRGIKTLETDPETIYWIEEENEEIKKYDSSRIRPPVIENGKVVGYYVNYISRKSIYEFMKEHWNCKRQFLFPNHADDFTPKDLPSFKQYEDDCNSLC